MLYKAEHLPMHREMKSEGAMKKILLSALCFTLEFASQAQQRIVSLNGTISEMLCALGLEQQIVGVDITSNYPEGLKNKPKLGHNMNISAEGVLVLQPTIVIGIEGQVKSQLKEQLQGAGIKTVLLKQDYSIAGTRQLLQYVAATVGATGKVTALSQVYDKQIAGLKVKPVNKKVLFIYARGAGSIMVSGTGTSLDKIIQLAGAKNAVNDFKDFKPYSSEALVAENPDVILLFNSGLQSVGDIEGLLKIPGIAQTTAGKKKQVISMDGEMLSGFGLRLPETIQTLNNKIIAFN